jgi:DNA replication licensing factor MCM2
MAPKSHVPKRSREGEPLRRPPAAAAGDIRDHDSDIEDEEEPEGEDLFADNYMKDYTEVDEELQEPDDEAEQLEDEAFIDDRSDASEMSEGDRREVDGMLEREALLARQLETRTRAERKRKDGRGAVFSDVDEDEDFMNVLVTDSDDEDDEPKPRKKRSAGGGGDGEDDEGSGAESILDGDDPRAEDELDAVYNDATLPTDQEFDWTSPQCDLAEWIAQELPRRMIKNRILHFLRNFEVNGTAVYEERVRLMTRDNAQSFEVTYGHLSLVYNSVLVLWLADLPEAMLELFDDAANYFVYRIVVPHYRNVQPNVVVRIAEMPLCDPIRDFRQLHMNVLVRVEGVVVRRSPVYPQMVAVRYDCRRCGFVVGPIYQRGEREHKVSTCPACHSKGPFSVNMSLTEYRNHQCVVLQEPPGKVPPGRLPRSLEVILTYDLIDTAKPGDEIHVTGVYKNNFDPLLNSRQGFPVFTTVLHANHVSRKTTDMSHFRLPDHEKRRLLELARHPMVKKKLLRSVAPSIHGRDDIKIGLLLAMLGGVPKDVGGDQSHKIRGDINVLLVGDPGCAKSQFLKFVEKTADRAVFTTGRGSTAVGLTASVHKDSISGDFVLEGGALVIADRGVCLIDEFDKMSDQDRTSIHEAMEQQTISVARGGIVTTLSARCCVMAAANPIGGRYDPSVSFDANVNLTTPILSRFDLLFVVRDEVNEELDEQLATFVCRSHQRNHPKHHAEVRQHMQRAHEKLVELRRELLEGEMLSQEERNVKEAEMLQLREELTGRNVREDDDPASPNPLPQETLRRYILFAKAHCTPRISNVDANTISQLYMELRQESKHGGIPITVRHMESIIRLSEAHARLHLREFVKDEDVSAAIALFLRCFLGTQKYSMRGTMEARLRKYLELDTEPLQLVHHHVKQAMRQTRVFERQLAGGVEPDVVKIDCADIETVVSGLGVTAEAIAHYYQSDEFKKLYTLIRDPVTTIPVQIASQRSA